jgi:ABC-type dipeptide/oligopeptide/nickel transport system permease subunit
MKNKKWFVANNKLQKNKDIVNILPFIKLWYSENYFLETGVFTPAFGIAISFLKWNYYFTMQQGYTLKTNI